MDEKEDVELRKLALERDKFEWEKEKEKMRRAENKMLYDVIDKIVEGPIGEAMKTSARPKKMMDVVKQVLDQPELDMNLKEVVEETEQILENLKAATEDRKYLPVPHRISFNPKTIAWYQWAKSGDYNGNLSDFVNEIILGWFKDQGLALAVIKTEKDA